MCYNTPGLLMPVGVKVCWFQSLKVTLAQYEDFRKAKNVLDSYKTGSREVIRTYFPSPDDLFLEKLQT